MQLGTSRSKTSIQQIEVITGMIVFQIGIKAQKTGKTHQKNKMEIRESFPALIQPNDGMLQISKQRTVLSLLPNSPIKEFRQKKCHRRFIRIIGNGRKRIKGFRLFHPIKSRIRSVIRLKFNKRQRLEQDGLHCRLSRTGYCDKKRSPSGQFRVHIYNDRRIIIF